MVQKIASLNSIWTMTKELIFETPLELLLNQERLKQENMGHLLYSVPKIQRASRIYCYCSCNTKSQIYLLFNITSADSNTAKSAIVIKDMLQATGEYVFSDFIDIYIHSGSIKMSVRKNCDSTSPQAYCIYM